MCPCSLQTLLTVVLLLMIVPLQMPLMIPGHPHKLTSMCLNNFVLLSNNDQQAKQQLEGCMTKQKTKLEQHATRGGDNAF